MLIPDSASRVQKFSSHSVSAWRDAVYRMCLFNCRRMRRRFFFAKYNWVLFTSWNAVRVSSRTFSMYPVRSFDSNNRYDNSSLFSCLKRARRKQYSSNSEGGRFCSSCFNSCREGIFNGRRSSFENFIQEKRLHQHTSAVPHLQG